ncbi:MAG: hypothetical protein ABJM29_18905 [Rhizobiaceae bacterium]
MSVRGLSHPRAITRIPDPIHEVIELTLFDRNIVDSRDFQRLHFVLQQSVNYVSFPANKNTRFPHSIGTAHVAGRLFSSALSNSDPQVLKKFLEAAGKFLCNLTHELYPAGSGISASDSDRDTIELIVSGYESTISGKSYFLHAPLMAKPESDTGDWRIDTGTLINCGDPTDGSTRKLPASFIIDTYWQALRIYALTHDIGHLPMSHAFENAVDRVPGALDELMPGTGKRDEFSDLIYKNRADFTGLDENIQTNNFFPLLQNLLGVRRPSLKITNLEKPLHELRSFAILNKLINGTEVISTAFPSLSPESHLSIDRYSGLINHLSLSIIYSSYMHPKSKTVRGKRSPAFLKSIRQLVDGTVDGDRLDYTLRDCHESGARFGDFDLEKIVGNALLIQKVLPKKSSPPQFAFGYGPRAVPGIEQFFEARFQSYRYLVHHRTASRSNIAVETLIEKMFAICAIDPGSEFADLMDRYGYIDLDKDEKTITSILPLMTTAIERIDDCSFRTLLHETKELFSKATYDDRIEEVLRKEICTLCDIVLFRELNNVVTLFKEHTMDSVLKSHLNMKRQAERRDFMTSIEANDAELINRLRKQAYKATLAKDDPITYMYEIIKPKVFEGGVSTTEPLLFEKTVWIRDPRGIDLELGDPLVSAGLHNMSKERGSETKLRLYAVAKSLKGNESDAAASNSDTLLVQNAEKRILDILKKALIEFRKLKRERAKLKK